MTSFTQIGWFGVGLAMLQFGFQGAARAEALRHSGDLLFLPGVCMTASAYFGIESLTIVSYIAVPSVAILGTIAMVMAVMRGDGTIIDQFAKSSGSLTIIGRVPVLSSASFVSGGTATPNFARFAKDGKAGAITTVVAFFIGNSLMFFFGAVSSIFVGRKRYLSRLWSA